MIRHAKRPNVDSAVEKCRHVCGGRCYGLYGWRRGLYLLLGCPGVVFWVETAEGSGCMYSERMP